MNSLFHGGSASVAALKLFNEKPYFPRKPSLFNNPSFFFQRISQNPHVSFSFTTAKTPKSIRKTTTWCRNGVVVEEEEEEEWTGYRTFMEYGGAAAALFRDDQGKIGDIYTAVSRDGMRSLFTKLDVAIETGIQEAIGVDLVALNVNNIVIFGAKPLYFRHRISTSLLGGGLAEKVLKGILDGCKQSDCDFNGEMDGGDSCFEGKYGLDGFAIGKVGKYSVIDGANIVAGDVLIGLPSSGIHCSGFSLVSRVLAQNGLSLKDQLPGGSGRPITLGEALMTPTVIYVKQVLDIISKGGVKGVAHIASGGFTDNIPRVFPKGLGATIYRDSWEVPAVFKCIQEAGRIEDAEMRRTFNMGIGMVLVVSPDAAARILREQHGEYAAYRIGEVTSREGVTYK
ncbi:phosphoribosylformylglycinamidine cyclo-ligase, chloroplastic/mitochondrial [Cinnamomum micranthum f. kanehirae]|uniref:phosphoribosylformylglycinamidine cyclo-ligase n=1 Tax=Cinnamomum micranthum f. kanehirae TaxID=337451 RepID=A0A443PH32_9MAGN|nr:phosphoribosylformylglycinamidine cyclo-ligase, chloroplastic/mitochondrial [Cinnamomum micranthum f. kanehirae]